MIKLHYIKNINNLRYTDDTILITESKEELLQTLWEKPVSQVPTSLPLLDLEKALWPNREAAKCSLGTQPLPPEP